MISTQRRESIIQNMDKPARLSHWQDWRWQLRHVVRDIETLEMLLGVTLDPETREGFRETIKKFPMSITPHYLSLMDVEDLEYDPIFRQSFPSSDELRVMKCDMADPLH